MAKDERLQRLSRELLIVALSTTRPSDSWVIERIVPWLEERHVPAGEAVYAEGAVPDQIYFVADGRVRFERAGHGSFVRAGRWVFGMYEVIAAVPRRRSAFAASDLHILSVPAEPWLQIIEDSVETVREMAIAVARSVVHLHASLPPDGGFPPASAKPVSGAGTSSLVERLLLLRAVPQLAGAGVQALTDIAGAAEVVTFAPGEALFERGAPRTHAHVVAAGLVEARHDDSGVSARFGPGSLAGGAVAAGDVGLTWELRALEPTRALALPLEFLTDEMDDHFDLFRAAMAALSAEREDLLDRRAAARPGLVLR